MTGSWITVPAADAGSFRAYVATPPAGRGPGLLLLQEIFGVNDTMRAHADELAGDGYTVVVPDLFWRIEPEIELDYSPEGWQRAFDLYGRFDQDQGARDIAATLTAARAHPACVGKVGALGYCLGGKLAFLAGCRTAVDCSVCYYGVGIEQNLDAVQLRRLDDIAKRGALAILRPGQAKGDKTGVGSNRLGELGVRDAPQAHAVHALGDDQRVTHRCELVMRQEHLSARSKASRHQPDTNGNGRDERNLVRVTPDQFREEGSAAITAGLPIPNPGGRAVLPRS